MKSKSKKLIMMGGVLVAMLFCMKGNAQIISGSSITGPLKVLTTDTAIVLTCTIASDADPTMSYSIDNQGTDAKVVSQPDPVFDQNTNVFVQKVTLNPGTKKGSFKVYSNASTIYGTSQAHMSITIVTP